MKKNILVILGMHRSGTSLITQWLYKCGLPIGEKLWGPDTGNAEGHFEDLEFVNLHRELLQAERLPDSGLTEKTVATLDIWQRIKLKKIIEAKNLLHRQWGWKDPRTCLFLPVYRDVLQDAKYLIILRSYQSAVSSLVNRKYNVMRQYYSSLTPVAKFFSGMKNKFNKEWQYKTCTEKYLKIWIAYNTALLHHIEALPRNKFMVVDYLTLIQDDRPVFAQLTDKWGFLLKHYDFKDIYRQELISGVTDIELFVNDSRLLQKAKNIEARLKGAMIPGGISSKTSLVSKNN